MSVLEDARELIGQADPATVEKIGRQIKDLRLEIEELDPAESERIGLKQHALASRLTVLNVLDRVQLHLERLLHQANRCEASLQLTRVEMAAILAGSSVQSVDSVIEALRGTIQTAKEVQEELRGMGI